MPSEHRTSEPLQSSDAPKTSARRSVRIATSRSVVRSLTMIETTHSQQQPQLWVRPVSLLDLGSGAPAKVDLEVGNAGHTSAQQVVVRGVCLISPYTETDDVLFPANKMPQLATLSIHPGDPPLRISARTPNPGG